MLSIVVNVCLTFANEFNLLTINIQDWRFGVGILLTYFIITPILLFFFKKVFPYVEIKTQLFDNVKSTTKDILYDVLDNNLVHSKHYNGKSEESPIWVNILTKDNISYTGNLVFQGLTKEKSEAIYIKQPKITNKDNCLNIDFLEGLLIFCRDIKWIGIINTDYKPKKK